MRMDTNGPSDDDTDQSVWDDDYLFYRFAIEPLLDLV